MEQRTSTGTAGGRQAQSPADELLSFQPPAADDAWWEREDAIEKFEQAVELLKLAREGDQLKTSISSNLDASGAVGLKKTVSPEGDKEKKDIERHWTDLHKEGNFWNRWRNTPPQVAKRAAKDFGLPVNKGPEKLSAESTLLEEKVTRFKELLLKVSPRLLDRGDYAVRLKEKLNGLRQGILKRFQEMQAEIVRLRREIVNLSGREAPPPPKPSVEAKPEDTGPKFNQALWRRLCETSDRHCPVTGNTMLKITYGGIELDVSAGGALFDYGELRNILGADDDSRIFANTTRSDNESIKGNPYIQTLQWFINQSESRQEAVEKITLDINKALGNALKTNAGPNDKSYRNAVDLVVSLTQKRDKLLTEGFKFLEPENYPLGYNKTSQSTGGAGGVSSSAGTGFSSGGTATAGTAGGTNPSSGGIGGGGQGSATSGSGSGSPSSGLPPSGGTGIGGASGSTPSGGSGSSVPGSPSFNPNIPKPPSPANSNDEKKDSSSGTDSKL